MNVVHSRIRISAGLDTCDLCDTREVRLIQLGTDGKGGCMGCLRAAMVELGEASGKPFKITTVIDGTEHTTRANMMPHEENDE